MIETASAASDNAYVSSSGQCVATMSFMVSLNPSLISSSLWFRDILAPMKEALIMSNNFDPTKLRSSASGLAKSVSRSQVESSVLSRDNRPERKAADNTEATAKTLQEFMERYDRDQKERCKSAIVDRCIAIVGAIAALIAAVAALYPIIYQYVYR